MERLKAEHISKGFDGTEILQDVSLTLRANEIVSLVGASGAGKTTLFHILSGLLLPDKGEVYLNGENITGTSGKVSYMLQKDLLLPYRTVLDNVILPLLIRGESKKIARQKAAALFADFGLEGCERQYPSQLSGGMRQRAALLRTYLFSGEVALLDEPFSALDSITKTQMHTWYLNVMQRIELSTLFITHDIDEAIMLSDRIYVLRGRPAGIVAEIPVSEPRPRQEEFALTPAFIAIKRQVLSMIRDTAAAF